VTDGHVRHNRQTWNDMAPEYADAGRRHWSDDDVTWGVFSVPEEDVGVLAGLDLDGADVVELGCGTGYVSAWLARRGARCVGLDNSPAQLATAQSLQGEFGPRYPLVHGDAERLPFADATFDIAISEYGASIWCDPYRWIPEAARVLRPGGRLVFLKNGILFMLCVPATDAEGPAQDRLYRPYFAMHRFEWPEDPGIEFHLGFGDWVRLLRANGFDVEDYVEVRPRPGATTTFQYVTPEWAQRWPAEEVWRARKR
jgi:ubiquinone/menaquinone biosynthesis C-methylase UbiE